MADSTDVLASPSGTLHIVDLATRETKCGTPVDDNWVGVAHHKRCFFCFGAEVQDDTWDDAQDAPVAGDEP
jgi:hypothetical protein